MAEMSVINQSLAAREQVCSYPVRGACMLGLALLRPGSHADMI